jgi:antitoxin (DNA-binding transcriptional repressor) of toxin-antitoxin stability system
LHQCLLGPERGEGSGIARAGVPVARLVPVGPAAPRIFGGADFDVPDDFDAPLPETELSAWE